MAILKFKDKGEWKSIAAFKGEDGKDGAIQYTAGPGIKIEDNVISATLDGDGGLELTVDQQPIAGSTNPVSSGGVHTALQGKADKSEIKTDTSELTNGAGFITGDDIPKDLGDLKNEAGFLTEESDPLFSRSPAASITNADKALWNNISDLHICPLIVNGNYTDTSSFNITSSTILNKLKSYIDKYGVWGTAIYLVTNYRAGLYIPVRDAVTGTTTGGTNEWTYKSIKADDIGSDIALSRLVVISKRSDGTYTKIEVSSYSAVTVAPSAVLKKTNTTAYTPTADYHPATKKYVDEQVAAGVEGIGGIEVEEDPLFMKSIASTITEEDITRWNNKADSGGIEFEEDPSVPTWVKGITEDDISNWNNKADNAGINSAVGEALKDKHYLSVNTGIVLEINADVPLTGYYNDDDYDGYPLYYNHSYVSAAYAQIYAELRAQLADGVIPSIILKHKFAGDDWYGAEEAVILLQYSPNIRDTGTDLVFSGLNTNYTVDYTEVPYAITLTFTANNAVNLYCRPLVELQDLKYNNERTPYAVTPSDDPWPSARKLRGFEISDDSSPLKVIMHHDGISIKHEPWRLSYINYEDLKKKCLRETTGTMNDGTPYKHQDYIIEEAIINCDVSIMELVSTESGYSQEYVGTASLRSSNTLGYHNDDITNFYYFMDYSENYLKPATGHRCTVTAENIQNNSKVVYFTLNVGANKDKPLKLRLEIGNLVNSFNTVETKSCIRLHLDNYQEEITEDDGTKLAKVHAYSDADFANFTSYLRCEAYEIFIPTPILLEYGREGYIRGYRDGTV